MILASIEQELFGMIGYESILRKALKPILDDFDHIIIDCPPSLGSLTINGLVACNEAYITSTCEHLSLIGVSKLLDTIDAVKENYNQAITVGKVIPAKVSPKLYTVHLSNHAQQGVDESFFQGFGVITANGIKILTQCGLGNDVSQIREGKTVSASDFMPTFGDIYQPCPIDPGNGSRHHREVDMVDHGMGITGLAFAAANVHPIFRIDYGKVKMGRRKGKRERESLEKHTGLSKLFKEDRFAFERERKRMIDEIINSVEDEEQRNRLRAFQDSWDKKMRGAGSRHNRFVQAQTLFWEHFHETWQPTIQKFNFLLNNKQSIKNPNPQ